MKFMTQLVLAGAVCGLGAAALADEAGMREYEMSCSICHGAGGEGDGEMAEFMTPRAPNLTLLKSENDGVFPMLDVIHVIDGRSGVRGHGTEMPIWGARYKAEYVEDSGPYGAEIITRGRVLSLAYYLESLQK